MIDSVRFVIAALLSLFGLVSILLATLGVFRFKFVMNRLHCAAIIDTLGALLIIAGLLFAAQAPVFFWKLLVVLLFLWIGSPVASHLLSRMVLATEPDAASHMEHDEVKEDEDGLL